MTRKQSARDQGYFAGVLASGAVCLLVAACSGSSTGISVGSGTAAIAGQNIATGFAAAPKTDFAGPPREAAAVATRPSRGARYRVGRAYQISGKWYQPKEDASYDRVGPASWYGGWFHGRRTANGEIFDARALTAAHPTLPLPSYVRVTNLENDRSIVVRVNDRGPYAHSRMIDVSERTAELLGFKQDGTTDVRVQYVDRARLDGDDSEFLLASYRGPDANVWEGADAAVASAEPRRGTREASADHVQQATREFSAQRTQVDRRPTPVAFISGGDGSADNGDAVFQAVTTAYDPNERILTAFEMASQAEY